MVKCKHVYFLPSEGFRKMSFRNRTIVSGSNGTINLSVPVEKGRNQKSAFGDIKISYSTPWQAMHWNTLTSCYGKSPFFEFYKYGLRNLFEEKSQWLFTHNLGILNWLIKTMKLPVTIQVLENGDINGFTDVRDICLPKNYLHFQPCPAYPQVFEDRVGFIPNLSILDLLFNTGPEAGNILNQFR